jgi:hypothetical protein
MGAALESARERAQRVFRSLWRIQDPGGLIRTLLADAKPATRPVVFVQTGLGSAALALAEVAARVGAVVYACDPSAEAIAELRGCGGPGLDEVSFLPGDTLESLARIAARHEHVDFALFDSAPSATHTLGEFQLLEPRLGPGSRVLVGDAALPGARLVLGPCRKGKLLVPYLLASPVWRVKAHPRAGDSMVSAIHDRIGARADASYEDPSYANQWVPTG